MNAKPVEFHLPEENVSFSHCVASFRLALNAAHSFNLLIKEFEMKWHHLCINQRTDGPIQITDRQYAEQLLCTRRIEIYKNNTE